MPLEVWSGKAFPSGHENPYPFTHCGTPAASGAGGCSKRLHSSQTSHSAQALGCGLKRLVFFSETETDQMRAQSWLREETRTRHRRHADILYQVPAKGDIVGKTEVGNVAHDVDRTFRQKTTKAGFLQNGGEQIAASFIHSGKLAKIAVRQRKRGEARNLQRRCCSHRKEVVDLSNGRCQIRRSNHPPDAPSGNRKRLA